MNNFVIKGVRYEWLQSAIDGYVKTKQPLIANYNGTLGVAGPSDDIGIYYFIPKIVSWFGLSLDQSLNVFYGGITVLSLLSGLIGFFFLYRKQYLRLTVSFIFLAWFMFFALRRLTEAYIIPPALVIAFVPWIMYSLRSSVKFSIILYSIVSFVASISHSIRTHAATGLLIFMITLIILEKNLSKKIKLVMLVFIVISFMIPFIYSQNLIDARDNLMKVKYPDYTKILARHPFWTHAYMGLSFVENPIVGPSFNDRVAIDKVMEINPHLPGADKPLAYLGGSYVGGYQEASDILKQEFFKVVSKHPAILFENFGTKLAILYIYFIISANIGVFFAIIYKKPLQIEVALWSGMLFNAIPGLMVVPAFHYNAAFIAFSVLYGLFSVNQGCSSR
ncbi:hypothetical protein [Candidatus Magnetomonas plexicatena]|uniref:hypothetical protein n=1 Tax=Candidatus Magnetomonas plexicatena TaxID=2552947 RepID=UPI001102B56F|nr:hypothetical protein E2O03_014345 [Nitrospirales bacterium LBB_01]